MSVFTWAEGEMLFCLAAAAAAASGSTTYIMQQQQAAAASKLQQAAAAAAATSAADEFWVIQEFCRRYRMSLDPDVQHANLYTPFCKHAY